MLQVQDNKKNVVARLAHSLGVAVLALVSVIVLGVASTMSTALALAATVTPLIMTGTFTSTPGPAYIKMAMDNFTQPTTPGPFGTPIGITTPEQAWPITGLFDYTFGTSVRIGLGDLEKQMAVTQGPIVIFGYSQSAVISNIEKRKLNAQYPVGTTPPRPISFVFIGDLNRPNGGVMTRFQGAYIPLINFYFNGPALTDTQFPTVDIARQYDGFADFPVYPINLLADANALAGIFYIHTAYDQVSLDPTSPLYVKGTKEQSYQDTTYYTIPTAHLPLLQPFRDLGVPEPLMAAIEPALKVLIETGYDRTINPGVPTPARLIPPIDPLTLTGQLVDAVGQGINDAVYDIEHPTPPPSGPTPTVKVLSPLTRTFVTHTLSASPLTGLTPASSAGSTAANRVAVTPEPVASPQSPTPTKTRVRSTVRGPISLNLPRLNDLVHPGRKHTTVSDEKSTTGTPVTGSPARMSGAGSGSGSAPGS